MTRSPNKKDMKDHIVYSSPIKSTTAAENTLKNNASNTAVIPKLKFSLKLTHQHNSSTEKPREHEAVRIDENTRPGLPKITLSVRKSSEERVSVVEPKSLVPSTSELSDPPKRKRGRPPKNPTSVPSTSTARRDFPKPPSMMRSLPSIGRPPMAAFVPPQKVMSPLGYDANRVAGSLKGPITAHTTIGDAELAKISRLKGHLATFVESDVETINRADHKRPFSSKQDMIERLLPFHLLSMADIQVYIPPNSSSIDNVQEEMQKLKASFETLIRNQNQQPIPTELRLLEQRLCLEEEKFLLEKMCNEYKRRQSSQ